MKAFVRRGVFCVMALAAATVAQAGMLVDVESGAFLQRGSWTNFGYTFTVNEQVAVTALGLWDTNSNGLGNAHPVGLWDSDGDLLAQAIVDSSSPLTASVMANQGWRFTAINTVLLGPGTYKIGAYYPTTADSFMGTFNGTTAQILVDPLASFRASFITSGIESLTEPVTPTSFNPGFFGPNAMMHAVPEPGTVALMGMGLAVLGLARRRR